MPWLALETATRPVSTDRWALSQSSWFSRSGGGVVPKNLNSNKLLRCCWHWGLLVNIWELLLSIMDGMKRKSRIAKRYSDRRSPGQFFPKLWWKKERKLSENNWNLCDGCHLDWPFCVLQKLHEQSFFNYWKAYIWRGDVSFTSRFTPFLLIEWWVVVSHTQKCNSVRIIWCEFTRH